jgi:hypothetical protein
MLVFSIASKLNTVETDIALKNPRHLALYLLSIVIRHQTVCTLPRRHRWMLKHGLIVLYRVHVPSSKANHAQRGARMGILIWI